jgi:hypothetical protein
VHKVENHFL